MRHLLASRALRLGALLGLLSTAPLLAQSTGRVTGRIVDGDQGTLLPGAIIEVVGAATPVRVQSGIDGRYVLRDAPTGSITLRVRLIGYQAKVVSGIAVTAGAITTQDIALSAQTVTLEELSVSAEAERGSVASALNEQRASANVVNAITAEEISRSPDGDAAQAVQRVSGVTVQDGKYVFVRGLGERYTTTSLNGARIPSPEPEKKVVPLDLYPAGLLEGISTSKTFLPDLPGDFSGAEVNIKTREFPANRQTTLSVSTGFNTRATGKDLYRPRNAGLEWLALGSSDRQLPSLVAQAGGFDPAPSQPVVNEMVNSFRNAWSPVAGTGTAPMSLGFSVGGSDPVFGRTFGYLLSLTYGYDQEVQDEQVRANALPLDTPGEVREIDRYEGSTGRGTVLWGGLFNLSTNFGSSSRISLNTSYNRSSDNDSRLEIGESENLGSRLQVGRLRYVERSTLSTQLLGEHQAGQKSRFDWNATYARVSRDEPDRSEIVYLLDTDPLGNQLPPAWFSISNEGAVRTFAGLQEQSLQGALNYRYTFGSSNHPHSIKIGGLYRATDRDADNNAYSISGNLDAQSQQLAPEQIFDGRFAEPTDAIFRITPLSQGGSYSATDRLASGYAMLSLFLSSKLEVVGGARLEHSRVEVTTQPTIGNPVTTAPEYTDVLPALAVNYSLSEKHILRAAASQTLSRPEYRELAPVQYREVIGAENVLGNPDLKRALIQNYDLRWEFYPSPAEVFSIGVFAKRFESPIEQVYLGTSGTRLISFVNAESGRNYGVELEARKNLGSLSEALLPFSVFANATIMESQVTIGEAGGVSQLESERAMVGQAPYVFNGGVSYLSMDGKWSVTALYNVVGRRIAGVGEAPLPNVYEEVRPSLDFSLRFPVVGGLRGKLDAENLLDASTRLTQGSVTKSQYYSGRKFGIGLTWTP
jgi:hypothetical protein